MTTNTTSLTPIAQIGKTILGTIRELYACTGLSPVYDLATSLNSKYGVAQTLSPTSLPAIAYFGIGIGGCFNVDTGNLTQPYPVLTTNMDLYTPIPFRCVPVEQDLSSLERAMYRMRVRKTINGADYYLYYLKVITYNQTTIQLNETDPVTGLESPYVLDYSNLNPTHPVMSTSGTMTSSATEVNASVTSTLPLTGAEVTEVINVLYAGDLRYAKISELGLYAGQDRAITGTDANNNPVNYTEAIWATLNMQYDWNGDDYSNPARSSNYTVVQGSGDLLIL